MIEGYVTAVRKQEEIVFRQNLELNELLQQSKRISKFSAEKNVSKELPAIEKSFQRNCRKVFRKTAKFERLFNRENQKRLDWEKKLSAKLELPILTSIKSISEQLTVPANYLNANLARGGKIFNEINQLTREQLEEEINKVIKNGVYPTIVILGNLKKHLEDNQQKIESVLKEKESNAFRVNISNLFQIKLFFTPYDTLLLDTSFAASLVQEKTKEQKSQYNLENLTKLANNRIIPTRVLEEMSYIPRYRTGPLVSTQLKNYLNLLGFSVKNLPVSPRNRQWVIDSWLRFCPKAKTSMGDSKQAFERSADLDILGYCLEHPQEKILILSQDNDLIIMSRVLRDHFKIKTHVASLKGNVLFLHQ